MADETSSEYSSTDTLNDQKNLLQKVNPHVTTIKGPTKNEFFKAVGYRSTLWLSFLYHLYGLVSLGFLYLLSYWKPVWGIKIKCKKAEIQDADFLLLKNIDGVKDVVRIQIEPADDSIPSEYLCEIDENMQGNYSVLEHGVIRYFEFQYLKYVWNQQKLSYECILGLKDAVTIKEIMNEYRGYTMLEQASRKKIFGKNEIFIEVPSYTRLLFTEVLNPFYIFQVFSLILWATDEYYQYAFCVFLISCWSITSALRETKKQSISLRDMVEASNTNTVQILQQTSENTKEEVSVNASSVVPGDILILPPTGCMMACDAVLISGNVIVNESMLTGESVPVTKTSVTVSEEDEIYSLEGHKRHTVFCGTTVLQTRYYNNDQVRAVVVRTGFGTAKGELVRSILYPRPIDFKFYKDAMKFILVLFFIAMCGMSYSFYLYISRNEPILRTIVRTLDIVTIVVPPALPAAMTVGTYYAQSRLKKSGIFCISPPRINLCGKVKLMCFDKTGTLTEDGLEVWGALSVQKNHSGDVELSQPYVNLNEIGSKTPLMKSLVSCHSLTYINGVMIGDPLDLKMFGATSWNLSDPEQHDGHNTMMPAVVTPPSDGPRPLLTNGSTLSTSVFQETANGIDSYNNASPAVVKPEDSMPEFPCNEYIEESIFQVPYEIGLLRQFPFTSSLQRMGVIIRELGSPRMEFLVKGAPEKIQTLCCPESLPADFSSVLNRFTEQGFRVIAFAHRQLNSKFSWLQAQKAKRDELEYNMTFVGFLVLQNVLKDQTTPVIKELNSANIRTVMITGDNVLTGISVARDCKMVNLDEDIHLLRVISHGTTKTLSIERTNSAEPNNECIVNMDVPYQFAVAGSDWALLREYFPSCVPYVVARGRVFGRMSPDQKVQLVEELQALDYIVGMCGDGANDCGALKAAHIGVSLSEAEASVAAPFTSQIPDIRCIPKIICEGRCALTTNFSVFKYMALYSIIQFISILILYTTCTLLSDPQFLYIDLFIVTLVAIFMGYTKPTTTLVSQRPLSNLFGSVNLFSVMSQILLVALGQLAAYFYLTTQPWYNQEMCEVSNNKTNPSTWETNVIFCVSSLQYLALAVIYSPGRPFRKPIYTNGWLLSSIILFTGISTWVTIYPGQFLSWLLVLKPFPDEPQWIFRITLLLIAWLILVIGLMVENYIAGSRLLKRIFQILWRKRQPKNLYKRILADENNMKKLINDNLES